jgi:uncharacterized protein YecE (DUF72 family)
VSARAWIGTSGWEYDHWRGAFYPPDVPKRRWLESYADRFDTVELNATFYRLPGADTFDRWGDRVPSGFRFAVKASRYLTHVRRLRDPDEPIQRCGPLPAGSGAASVRSSTSCLRGGVRIRNGWRRF